METLLKIATNETSKNFSSISGSVKDIVVQTVNRGAADNSIRLARERLTESEESGLRNADCLLRTPTFTAPITKLDKRHAKVAVAKNVIVYNRCTNVGKANEGVIPQSPLSGRSPASTVSSKHDQKKKSEKKEASHCSGPSGKKCGMSQSSTEDYKVDSRNKDAKHLNVLRLVNTHLTKADSFNMYRLDMQSQKYKTGISGKIVKRAKQMDVQMKSTNFKHSIPNAIRYVLENLKKACDSYGIREGATMGHFQLFTKQPAKVAWARRTCARKKDDPQREWKMATYSQVINYLLATYATDYVIAEVGSEITSFKHPEGMP